MTRNILNFPTNFTGNQEGAKNKAWLAGYAAGIADAKRGGADCFDLIRDSGLSLQDFIDAETDEYDLEDLKDYFKQMECEA